jgi:hypothetical protein
MESHQQRPPPDLDRVREAMREEREELDGERQRQDEEQEEEQEDGRD